MNMYVQKLLQFNRMLAGSFFLSPGGWGEAGSVHACVTVYECICMCACVSMYVVARAGS